MMTCTQYSDKNLYSVSYYFTSRFYIFLHTIDSSDTDMCKGIVFSLRIRRRNTYKTFAYRITLLHYNIFVYLKATSFKRNNGYSRAYATSIYLIKVSQIICINKNRLWFLLILNAELQSKPNFIAPSICLPNKGKQQTTNSKHDV